MHKRKILILDCTPKDEPSEGRLLKEFFQICKLRRPSKASSLYYKINSKTELLSKLSTGKRYDIIHISAHGPRKRTEGVYFGNGRTWDVYPDEVRNTNHKAKLVFVDACVNSNKKMAKAFSGAKYFLAPNSYVDWADAAIFSILFYKRYIVDNTSMESAFNYARERTQTVSDYPNYWE